MATLKQAEAVLAIYKRLGKTISFDEVYFKWSKARAWKFIHENYLSFYDIMRQRKERLVDVLVKKK